MHSRPLFPDSVAFRAFLFRSGPLSRWLIRHPSSWNTRSFPRSSPASPASRTTRESPVSLTSTSVTPPLASKLLTKRTRRIRGFWCSTFPQSPVFLHSNPFPSPLIPVVAVDHTHLGWLWCCLDAIRPDCYGLVVLSLTHIPTRAVASIRSILVAEFAIACPPKPMLPIFSTLRAISNVAASMPYAPIGRLHDIRKRPIRTYVGFLESALNSGPASRKYVVPTCVKRVRL